MKKVKKEKKFARVLLALVMVSVLGGCGSNETMGSVDVEAEIASWSDDMEIQIKDPKLQKVLKKEIEDNTGVGSRRITYGDVKDITKLWDYEWNDDGIQSIKYFTSLEDAEIKVNSAKLDDLIYCRQLKKVTVHGINNAIVKVLDALTHSMKIKFDRKGVTDISVLGNLTNLKEVKLIGTGVTDISALEDLTNLESLWLSESEITDISALENLTNLDWLCLDQTEITDISALENLTNLEYLWLDQTEITDISALENLTKLKWLCLSETEITDISALENLTNLEDLWLNETEITDISALKNLTNLYSLDLEGTDITDFSVLDHLENTQINYN